MGLSKDGKASIGVELRENPARCEIPRSLLVSKLALSAKCCDPKELREGIEYALERRADREAERLRVDVHDGSTYGSFYRQIPLPEDVKSDTAEAKFSDGVLEIMMQASRREPRGRRLEIRAAEEPAKAKAAAPK